MMKGCELCGGVARMYCESDQASLCWSCDEKVHSANFLVAKHSRILLCQVCQSPTPWKASGPKLGPTVSICESCFSLHNNKDNHNNHAQQQQQQGRDIDRDDDEESFGGNDELDSDDDGDDDFSDQDDDDDEEEEEEEEDGDNQVVPWSVTAPSPPPPPPVASSSSSEEEEEEISSRFLGGSAGSLKRGRENSACIDSDDDIGCSYTQMGSGRLSSNDELESCRPLKQQRRKRRGGGEAEEEEVEDHHNHHHHHHHDHDGQEESRSTAIIDSLKRLQSQTVTNRENASATIVGICRLSKDHHSR